MILQAFKGPAQECPSTHMFAFANGRACCTKSVWSNDTTRPLSLDDPEELCDIANKVSCPDLLATCKDHNGIGTILLLHYFLYAAFENYSKLPRFVRWRPLPGL